MRVPAKFLGLWPIMNDLEGFAKVGGQIWVSSSLCDCGFYIGWPKADSHDLEGWTLSPEEFEFTPLDTPLEGFL